MTNNESIKPSVGFVGLGNMGMPMSKHILDAGYRVYGYDADSTKKESFEAQGGIFVTSLAEFHDQVEWLLLSLPSSKIVREVLFGAQGLYEQSRTDSKITRIIDMGSSYPLDTQKFAEHLKEFGVELFDAPVSGGVKKAETGELTIMIGGEDEQVEAATPLLALMGTNRYHAGKVGAGHAIKALNNYLSATHLFATAEAVAAIEKMGIDPAKAIEIINVSSGRSGSSEYKFPAFILGESYRSGFSLGLLAKDVGMSESLISEFVKEDTLVPTIADFYRRAVSELGGLSDHTEINKWVQKVWKSE